MSSWWGHVPFMHWLVSCLRPRLAVELGTHHGVSFAALCEAMQRGAVAGRAYAVDTWLGDAQTGFYDESVFTELSAFVAARYAGFAELMRLPFGDARAHFADGSIDLLHIDGLHTYEAVRDDFLGWRPKLSESGVVLFHDTNVRRDDFGVWRLWEELARDYPAFEFLHGHGLGILAVGPRIPVPVEALCALEPAASAGLRERFAQIGARWIAEESARRAAARRPATEPGGPIETALRERTAELEADVARLTALSEERRQRIGGLEAELAAGIEAERGRALALLGDRDRRIGALEAERAQDRSAAAALERRIGELDAERGRSRERASDLERDIARLQAERIAEQDASQAASSALRARNAALEDRIARLDALSVERERRVADLDAACRRLADVGSARRHRIAELEAERGRLALSSRDFEARIADLQAEREREAELSAVQFQHVAELEAARAQDGARIHELEARRLSLIGRVLASLRPRAKPAGSDRPDDATLGEAAEREVGGTGTVPNAELIVASGLFDPSAYAGASEARRMGLGAAEHYLLHGEAAGLEPSRHFDPRFYRARHADLSEPHGGLLVHYIRHGHAEGRSPLPVARSLPLPAARTRPGRATIVVAAHEATRTGAPILAWNLVRALAERYDVVALLGRGGPLVTAFADAACATIVLPDGATGQPAECEAIAAALVRAYAPLFAIANSAETRHLVPGLEKAGVPTLALIHEFSGYVRPRGTLHPLLRTASEIVFPASLVADATRADYAIFEGRTPRILPQGRCRLPPADEPRRVLGEFDLALPGGPARLPPEDGTIVVIGLGTIIPRKGVDLFAAVAASIARRGATVPIVFAWIGAPHAAERAYLDAVCEQVARSDLGATILFLGESDDLAPVYARADLALLSSRLDPLPNVAIDAASQGIPVVCFEKASGMAELLATEAATRDLVVPHLDVESAAKRIVALAEDPARRAAASDAVRALAARTFDMERYTATLSQLGEAAALAAEQARARSGRDRRTILDLGAFDADFYRGVAGASETEAVDDYLDLSRRLAPRGSARTGLDLRRPLPGFHPLIYAGECPDYDEGRGEDPLAHFARRGFPAGRWRHPLIRPGTPAPASGLRVALHGHFHYPELLPDLIERIRRNATPVDLILTAEAERVDALARIVADLGHPNTRIVPVPNRGRDLGPLLIALGRAGLAEYDVVGHVHGKRSPHARRAFGERWRTFLWEHLVGGTQPMLDTCLAAFAADPGLGLVFPEDPYLVDWTGNRRLSQDLATRMGVTAPLPDHFDFPIGTMFWARPAALDGLFGLGLSWEDFPEEPLPIDGTILHAIERLIPFSAALAGYSYATTCVDQVFR